MKIILIATDFSARSDRAIRRAANLARDNAAQLVLVHVVDDDQLERLVAAESQMAEALLNETVGTHPDLSGIACVPIIALGEAFNGIVATAQKTAADIIVIGAHRRQILRDIFVGTTVERVIRTTQTPVLMAHSESKISCGRSLAAVDFSDCSHHAVKIAHTLGLLSQTRVVFLHVFDAMAKGMMYYANVDKDKIVGYVADVALRTHRDMQEFLVSHDLRGIDHSVILKEGSPAKAISDAADDIRPDFIIIGTHGRSGMAKAFLGSVAEEVLQRARHDVLVVPRPR